MRLLREPQPPRLLPVYIYLVTTGTTLEGRLDTDKRLLFRRGRDPIPLAELEPCLVTREPVTTATAEAMIEKLIGRRIT